MPKTLWTYESILEALPPILSECLGVDTEDVKPESHFYDDLGGESIDEIDLSFRCERAFQVRSPFAALLNLSQFPVDENGMLYGDSWEQFLREHPHFHLKLQAAGKDQLTPLELRDYFTVSMIARFIETAAQRQADQNSTQISA